MSAFVLGLDGGGTKVVAEVATSNGLVVGRGIGGACNIAVMSAEDALASAMVAATAALAEAGAEALEIRAVCAGVAGTSFAERCLAFQDGLAQGFPSAKVEVLPDYAIAHTAALNGAPGVIVIAGTGSIAYGESAAGLSHRTGGYGYLIDDAGSGYGVGRAGLAAALRAFDGSGEPTALLDLLLTRFSVRVATDFVPLVYGGALDRVTMAGLAETVAAAAKEGDPVSIGILISAGNSLADLVRAIHDRLFQATPDVTITLAGGLWNISGPLRAAFDASVSNFAPNAAIIQSDVPPVRGAVMRAVKMVGT